MEKTILTKLNNLSNSKFRNSFHLKKNDLEYIKKKGLGEIQSHAYDFVNKRLKDISKFKDGKQTPMRGHPVFVAQHATATCCRECLSKWHKIEKKHVLNEKEIEFVVNIIMAWIEKEINNINK